MNVVKHKLGFLVSGHGSNMRAIVMQCRSGKLAAEPVVVISNNANAKALDYARDGGLSALHINAKTPAESADHKITEILLLHKVDWVILAGYTQLITGRLLQKFAGKIVNIHPSLLPRHGGKGMYGLHVHRSVLAAGDVETGATVHLVNGDYDSGKILAQAKLLVKQNDTAESLAHRVLELEHQLYWQTLSHLFERSGKDEQSCTPLSVPNKTK